MFGWYVVGIFDISSFNFRYIFYLTYDIYNNDNWRF